MLRADLHRRQPAACATAGSRQPDSGRAQARRHSTANKLVARAEAEGLPLAAGTDLRYTTRDLSMADEALSFQRAGVSPMRALQIMTAGSATCLGIQNRTGAIAPGLEADLVVLAQNPLVSLEALKRITTIINDGKIAFRAR